jgi:hypothetical protein
MSGASDPNSRRAFSHLQPGETSDPFTVGVRVDADAAGGTGTGALIRSARSPGFQAPKTTRVPVDGITSVFGIATCTAMIVYTPEQCMAMM